MGLDKIGLKIGFRVSGYKQRYDNVFHQNLIFNKKVQKNFKDSLEKFFLIFSDVFEPNSQNPDGWWI